MNFLLLDEGIAKRCVDGGNVYTAQRSVHTEGLGFGADDLSIYHFVLGAGAALVTLNGRDFVNLSRARGAIPLIILPPVPALFQHVILLAIMRGARAELEARRIVEADASGQIIAYEVESAHAQRETKPVR